MLRTRVIPALLLREGGLVKTQKFADATYIGDPINAVRIFNEKEVDELVLLDIDASRQGREPDYNLIKDVVSEAFMPIGYGGGVTTVEQAQRLVSLGVEKVVINSASLGGYDLIEGVAERLGASSTVLSVDVKKDFLGRHRVFNAATGKTLKLDLVSHLSNAVKAGAGEIFLNSVDHDGMGQGLDLVLISKAAEAVNVPIVACGGAATLQHLRGAVNAGASAVAAGSMFVFMGRHRAVMINYPSPDELREVFGNA